MLTIKLKDYENTTTLMKTH